MLILIFYLESYYKMSFSALFFCQVFNLVISSIFYPYLIPDTIFIYYRSAAIVMQYIKYNNIVGSGLGLAYAHQTCPLRILH